MQAAQRVIINTAAQYTRTIINILLSLYSTRLVLDALGKSDYGIFQLVGGVVAMLSFLTNAMVVTTQRHLSFAHGRGEAAEIRRVFANSLLLHFIMGLALVLILATLTPWITDFLEIEPTRIDTARSVYLVALLTLFISFMVAPYRALFIARENIVYISVVDVMDGVLKVLFVFFFLKLFPDRLLAYTFLMSALRLFHLLALSIYGRINYEEVCIVPSRFDISAALLRKIVGFAGWTTYSMGCVIARNQGLGVVLNKIFKNTIINAAYGLAMQVSSSAAFVSQSLCNALSPQLIKAEGGGYRERMLSLASTTSKYSFLLLAMVVMPLIAEMRPVLDFWLGSDNYPEETVLFCRVILIATLCDQLTIGLNLANQAIGRIRTFSLTINTIKVLTLPCIVILVKIGCDLSLAIWSYVAIELFCAVLRIPFLKYMAGLSVRRYFTDVFARVILPSVVICAVCYWVVNSFNFPFRFLVTLFMSVLFGGLAVWAFGSSAEERLQFRRLIN